MAVTALGYLGVRSEKLDDWSYFAGRLLGMQRIDRSRKTMAFRMDDREQRLIVADEPGDSLAFMGWEVEQQSDLDTYAARLEEVGTRAFRGPKSLADQRFVDDILVFDDPIGNRVELFWNPMIVPDSFVPGRPITGFKTGPMGMGHAVLHVTDIDVMLPFYRDVLDFHVSDYSLEGTKVYFFHVNSRHHSFAMIGSGTRGFHHFMVEYNHLDDVGQGYDLACLEKDRVAYTLGRHSNDYMTSYYARTPSDFFIESGWGGRQIDPKTWVPIETSDGPSFWGHEHIYLPEEEASRLMLRELRLDAAARGVRAPPIAECPWLYDALIKGRN